MNTNLFQLALDRLQPSQWEAFEQLASKFLVAEFDELRTMAAPSGDGGRDSELFSPTGKSPIAFQYSIAKDWRGKIRQTVARLAECFPDTRILVYLTNHQIGGSADPLKREILAKGLTLDIRDRSWFLDRSNSGGERELAAEHLVDKIARPYLAGEEVISKSTSPLTSDESRAALVYLSLQWRDDLTDKGLTKVSFDALVRAALRHTDSSNRMRRAEIHKRIALTLPSHSADILAPLIDSALERLTKRYIRHWRKEDEFCLTHEEHCRIQERLAEKENEESRFREEVERLSCDCLTEIQEANSANVDDLTLRVPRVLEDLFLHKGEAFVSSVMSGQLDRLSEETLRDRIYLDLANHPHTGTIGQHLPAIIGDVIQSILSNADESTHNYLRSLADSYTLYSFLCETPDVQSATRKLFSHGRIWLDTTVLLPILAEQLEEDVSRRRLSSLVEKCTAVGMQFRVTSGVLQEVIAHMDVSKACSGYSTSGWTGRIPYLYYNYLNSGRPPLEFGKWLSLFHGEERPEEDIAQFLREEYRIERQSLTDESMTVDEDLRFAADRLWTELHQARRRVSGSAHEQTTLQLIKHDLETYLGVVALRQREQVSELGFRHWLLSFDRIAWQIRNRLRAEFANRTPPSPLLSLDFLVTNLTFGPDRRGLTRAEEQKLPIVLDVEMSESMPQEILKIAEEVRAENEQLPEYVIRRKVRDAIDRARRHRYRLGEDGYRDAARSN